MEFKKIENSYSVGFKEAWKIYEQSFPLDNKRTLDIQKNTMKNKKYNFFAVLKNKKLVAMIADWNFETFFFIEHLAVRMEIRGKGIGAEMLKEYISQKKQKIIIEVERPITEIAVRRIKFYERFGFKLNTFEYIQPSYSKDKNPIFMFLMTYPEKISKSEFSSIREKLHTTVYGLKKPFLDNQIKKSTV